MIKITRTILYWIMVAAIVTGAVYSYQKVQFGRKIASLYQIAAGNMGMEGPGGGPPGGGQMDMGRGGGQQPGMGSGDEQGQMQSGQRGFQSSQMGVRPEDGQERFQRNEGGNQGPPQGSQNMEGDRPDFQGGGREGGPHGGMGPGGGKWYSISLRNIGPYACLLAFFILITCIIEKGIKRFSRSGPGLSDNAA